MLKLLIQGGVVLIPILALSVIALALIIERILFFYRNREVETDLGVYVVERLKASPIRSVFAELENKKSPEAKVLLAGLLGLKARMNTQGISQRMESQGLRCADELEKNVPYLSSIANLTTLLGLLGTVSGMIISFLNLKVSGISDPALLAGGISQALITTAAGLSVAIPCLLFFHIFRQMVNRNLSRVEIATAELLSFLSKRRSNS